MYFLKECIKIYGPTMNTTTGNFERRKNISPEKIYNKLSKKNMLKG